MHRPKFLIFVVQNLVSGTPKLQNTKTVCLCCFANVSVHSAPPKLIINQQFLYLRYARQILPESAHGTAFWLQQEQSRAELVSNTSRNLTKLRYVRVLVLLKRVWNEKQPTVDEKPSNMKVSKFSILVHKWVKAMHKLEYDVTYMHS